MKIKKLFSLFLATAIFTLLCSSQALAANALQNSGTTVDTPYEYPVVPGTSEWYELTSLEDKIAICHVDEELLVSMTTPALLETVLNYPLLINIYAFDSTEAGIKSVSQYFSGIEILFDRADAAECIATFYETQTFSENEEESLVRSNFLMALGNHISASDISPLISTPSGTPVVAYANWTWANHDMTEESAQANHNVLEAVYPRATVVSGINPAYNCHSYAWYSTSLSNKYWINDPDPYMSDGSYYRQNSPSVGNKACWSTRTNPTEHSAIVRSVSGGNVTFISKWGFNGVFIHSAGSCRAGRPDWAPFSCRRRTHIIYKVIFNIYRKAFPPLQSLVHSLVSGISCCVNSSCYVNIITTVQFTHCFFITGRRNMSVHGHSFPIPIYNILTQCLFT